MSAVADRLVQTPDVKAHAAPTVASSATLTMRKVSGAQWDHLIADFDEVCQEQMHAFAAARWPSVVQEPVVFEQDSEIVGGTLMMIQKLPLGVSQIALSKWGPMLRDTQRPDAAAIYAGMVDALVGEYADRRRQMLSVLPHAALGPVNTSFEQLRDRGFRPGTILGFPNRYIVNLRLSDEAQRKSLQQTWRRQLTKSEKSGLSFEHAGPERIGEFDALYHAMTDRKQFPDHSAYETVSDLMGIEVAALRPKLFFVRHEGEVVAGALIFAAGDRAVYLYGATNDKALPLRAGYFMHWHIIGWLRDNSRARWYDLGGTDGFQGLHQFKKGMVGEAGLIVPVPPVSNYASSPVAFLLGNGAFLAREAFHKARNRLVALLGTKARPDQDRSSNSEHNS